MEDTDQRPAATAAPKIFHSPSLVLMIEVALCEASVSLNEKNSLSQKTHSHMAQPPPTIEALVAEMVDKSV